MGEVGGDVGGSDGYADGIPVVPFEFEGSSDISYIQLTEKRNICVYFTRLSDEWI